MPQPPSAQEAARQEALELYLAKRISGVGPVKARQLVGQFGAGIVRILDSPAAAAVERLCELHGVGRLTAAKFKKSWDAGARKCEGRPCCMGFPAVCCPSAHCCGFHPVPREVSPR